MLNGEPLPTSFNSKNEIEAILQAGTYNVTLKSEGKPLPESDRTISWWALSHSAHLVKEEISIVSPQFPKMHPYLVKPARAIL